MYLGQNKQLCRIIVLIVFISTSFMNTDSGFTIHLVCKFLLIDSNNCRNPTNLLRS